MSRFRSFENNFSGRVQGYKRIPDELRDDERVQQLHNMYLAQNWARIYSFNEFLEIYMGRQSDAPSGN